MKSMCGCEGKCANPHFGLFLLRAVTGFVFIFHGLMKFQDLAGTQGFFKMLALAPWLANFVALVEVVGGIALVLGIWTCIFAPLLSIIMAVAIVMVKWKGGWAGMELEVMLLASTLTIKSVGCGNWKVKGSCGCQMCKKAE